jgi:hypothetical protein
MSLRLRSSSLVLALGPLAVLAFAQAACVTETIVQKAAPAPDGGPAAPEEGEDGGGPTNADAGPAPDRSVKGTFEKVTVKPPDGDPILEIASVVVRAPDDVYVAEGSSNLGTGYYHYDGKSWTGVRYPGHATRLVPLASGDLLAHGADLNVKTKSGDDWQRFPQPSGSGGPLGVWSLWGTSTKNLYAGSGAGNVRYNGVSWSPISGLPTKDGTFSGTSDKDVWFAVADYNAVLFHYDGTTWTKQSEKLPAEVKTTPAEGPYGLFAVAADDVWAIGRRRTLIHYDGSAWSVVPGPDDEWGCDLTRLWASSKKNAWLVGKAGCVFHWDGQAWEKIPSGVTDDIYGIHGSDPEHVWIAPYNKTTVLRLKPE